jgi:ferrous iron transport protein B
VAGKAGEELILHGPVSETRLRESARPATGPVVLVGNPNVGKSALFGALTGSYVTVSNYAGTTVEITRGSAVIGDRRTTVIDTPGTNSFLPATEDERVTRDILLDGEAGAVVAVGDAKNLTRTLQLALQLGEMEVPYVLCLNMMDEAEGRGIRPDERVLADALGVEVVPTTATRGEGLDDLRRAAAGTRAGTAATEYPEPIERAVAAVVPLLPPTSISRRSLALMVLSGDEALRARVMEQVDRESFARIEKVRDELQADYREPVAYVVNRARLARASQIADAALGQASGRGTRGSRFAARLDDLVTHPIWGVPILGAILYLVYQFVGVFGAGTLVDLMESGLFGEIINPAATYVADRFIPFPVVRDLLVGEYGIVTMALTYSLALVFPIVGTFFLAFGLLEDSGYLPRLAVMLNRVFKRIGLNGKAVLPMVLGLGCDTMATLTTRILETRKERLIVIVLLALGVPCSAQLTVILAILGTVSMAAVGIWLAVVVAVLLIVGRLASWVLPGRGSDFVLELPPLRVPGIKNILVKTVARIEWYLKEAVPLFVLGTVILFVFDRLNLLGVMERASEPILSGLLGLPRETAEAFIIGFLRRDFGAAGLYHMAENGLLAPIQVVVAVVTITLFIPCIANFFIIVKERGWRTGTAIALFIFPFALLVGAGLNWLLRALALPL